MTIELKTTLDHFIVNNNGVNHKFQSMSDAVAYMDNEMIKSESPRDVPSMQILRNQLYIILKASLRGWSALGSAVRQRFQFATSGFSYEVFYRSH